MENRVEQFFSQSIQKPFDRETLLQKGRLGKVDPLADAPRDTVTLPRKGPRKKESFSVGAAAKHFVKGVFSPFVTMLKHPLMTVGALAATVTVASFAPVTIPLMVLGGLGYGVYQGGKGVLSALSNYRAGDYDAAEKAFARIGEGAFAAGASALGVRSAGAIAAETKATSAVLKTAQTSADKLKAVETGIDAGLKVRQGSWLNALKENVFLVTSKDGGRGVWSQLNPRYVASNLYARGKEVVRMFKEPPVADVDKALRAAQQHLGIADKDMPALVRNLVLKDPKTGANVDLSGIAAGLYHAKHHHLHVQPNGYQFVSDSLKPKGLLDFRPDLSPHLGKLPTPLKNFLGNWTLKNQRLDLIIAHELTHARQGLKIQQLTRPQAEAYLKKSSFGKKMEPNEMAEMLDKFRFAEGQSQPLKGQALQEAQDTLGGFVKALQGNREALNGNYRPYIASPAEVEARLEAAKFSLNRSLDQVGQNSARGAQALKDARAGVVEVRMNQGLQEINRLEGVAGSAQQIQETKSLIQAHRGVFGTQNHTSHFLDKERKAERTKAFGQWLLSRLGKAKPD